MSVDPLSLVDMARPKPAEAASSFAPQAGVMRRMRDTMIEDHEGNPRSMAELATTPGSPSYRDKIPKPPCLTCGSDHNPIKEARGEYDHVYARMEESTDRYVGPNIPAPLAVQTPAVASPSLAAVGVPARRLSVFPGRGDDDYVLIVEQREGDDWEDFHRQKIAGNDLARLLPVLRALDVKLKDRTGGDLVELSGRELT